MQRAQAKPSTEAQDTVWALKEGIPAVGGRETEAQGQSTPSPQWTTSKGVCHAPLTPKVPTQQEHGAGQAVAAVPARALLSQPWNHPQLPW